MTSYGIIARLFFTFFFDFVTILNLLFNPSQNRFKTHIEPILKLKIWFLNFWFLNLVFGPASWIS